jgi:hypothetical protein
VTCSGQYTHLESDLYITFLPVPYGSPTVSSEICITGMYMLYLDSDIYIYITFLPVPYGSSTVSSEICITGTCMYTTCITRKLFEHRVSPNRISNKEMGRIYKQNNGPYTKVERKTKNKVSGTEVIISCEEIIKYYLNTKPNNLCIYMYQLAAKS